MSPMKRNALVALVFFSLGVWVGSIRVPSYGFDHKGVVQADFCFILRNPDLIGSRRFMTSANIEPIFPHAAVLESDSCPRMGASFSSASFTEALDRQDHNAELNQIFRNDPYDSVPVVFEGTLYRPSLLRRLWYGARTRLGLSGDETAPITIRAYDWVGEDEGLKRPAATTPPATK